MLMLMDYLFIYLLFNLMLLYIRLFLSSQAFCTVLNSALAIFLTTPRAVIKTLS